MPACFVIQPFHNGKYDKRFHGCFKPAIEVAGLEAYRVDHDPSVDVPISSIEEGIKNAAICLAEITEDNPNVWYELGYAFAIGKPVVMVCADSREKFPFDIQHRNVIRYGSEAPQDFEILKNNIAKTIKARLSKAEIMSQFADSVMIEEIEGLSNQEIVVIALIATESLKPDDRSPLRAIKIEAENQGMTAIAFQLAIRRLNTKSFVVISEYVDSDGYEYPVIGLTENAWKWIDKNEGIFKLKKSKSRLAPPDDFSDEDIPF